MFYALEWMTVGGIVLAESERGSKHFDMRQARVVDALW